MFDASVLACVLLPTGAAATAAWESWWELRGTAPGTFWGCPAPAHGEEAPLLEGRAAGKDTSGLLASGVQCLVGTWERNV